MDDLMIRTAIARKLEKADPELAAIVDHFAGEEVPGEAGAALPERTRYLAILAALLGCQGIEAFRAVAAEALDAEDGVSPVELKEVVYQAVDYLGVGRVLPFVAASNEVLAERGVELPLEGQGTVTPETRLEAGNACQIEIFGEGMRASWEQGPQERRHINRWLAANCFGDYYTRAGLTLAEREMVTFCYLIAQGGCEPQATAHAGGSLSMGNDKAFLYAVVSQCLPYIGYPRSLNALACIDKATEEAVSGTAR